MNPSESVCMLIACMGQIFTQAEQPVHNCTGTVCMDSDLVIVFKKSSPQDVIKKNSSQAD